MSEQENGVSPTPQVTAPEPDGGAEITLRAIVLGLVLSVVMGAANTYLGLKVGITVSASIPAAVVSMAILRGVMRRGSILENNIVQTMASTGESLAAGAIFTIPALLLVQGGWEDFRYWPTTLIVMSGGLIGIVFMVPIRRALIVNRPDLQYPEGTACAEVLRAGDSGGVGMKLIGLGAAIGAGVKLLVQKIHVIPETIQGAVRVKGSVFYAGMDVSPALIAVGYIVGPNIAVLVFLGGVIGWGIGIPFLATPPVDLADGGLVEAAFGMWSKQIRYMGAGAMLVGGLHSIWSVRGGMMEGLRAMRSVAGAGAQTLRTERDLPLGTLAVVLGASLAIAFGLCLQYLHGFGMAVVTLGVMTVAAFLFVAVATYIVGLVGSTNSPVSGMTICALLMTAAVLALCGMGGEAAITGTLVVAGIVCCAACTSGDVAQDLKTGILVGATPARQQGVEILAAAVSAFFFAPIMAVLHEHYVIGSEALSAPQAGLFAGLVNGFFGDGEIQWKMIGIGAGVGVALVAIDTMLKAAGQKFRLHVMPVAVGIYLPVSMATPILLGGVLHLVFSRKNKGADDSGVLMGSGVIAGEALMGIGLAVWMVMMG